MKLNGMNHELLKLPTRAVTISRLLGYSNCWGAAGTCPPHSVHAFRKMRLLPWATSTRPMHHRSRCAGIGFRGMEAAKEKTIPSDVIS